VGHIRQSAEAGVPIPSVDSSEQDNENENDLARGRTFTAKDIAVFGLVDIRRARLGPVLSSQGGEHDSSKLLAGAMAACVRCNSNSE
jgi:hypothetical protein